MASKSKGTPPKTSPLADANQAHGMLGMVHHWSCTKVNGPDGRVAHEVTITHAGRRVTAQRRYFVDAVADALDKLAANRTKKTPRLRLVK
jgi:hypothetical protein